MARLSLLSLSAEAMVAAVFTEEEEDFTVGEDFMEAGLVAVGFTAGAGSEAAGSTVEVVFMAEEDSAAELSVAAGFAGGPAFAEELSEADSGEAFVAMASGAVSVSAVEALDGEVGAGVGA